ncbi:uncharacterized protein PAC_19809 [Phialocephala subalpina]|uniref:Heterokaryon incompatibility domain-containing protein n=1 Tax=Phialocephala subalpina TaxID=576137 RepID=A0A1L7XY29_9HELO|nr:uncharacterized protein PAC_19809 [Phialocephala subalpina]
MLKAFKKLKTKLGKDDPKVKYPGGVCEYCSDVYWSSRLANQDHCAICRMIVNIMQPHYDALDANMKYIAQVRIDPRFHLNTNYRTHPMYNQYQQEQNDLLYGYAGYSNNAEDQYEELPIFRSEKSAVRLLLNAESGSARVWDEDNPPEIISRHLTSDVMFISREDVPPQGFLRPRLVKKSQVSFNLVQEWLNWCDRAHGSDCSHHPWATVPNTLSTLRVIDVQNDCLVMAPPNCKYITLSYVWGAGKTVTLHEKDMPSLSMPGSLVEYKNDMAPTILDAMKLTKEIGQQYLWVDGICIFQDSADKAIQIAAMDQVYLNSMLTIVAASGIDSSAGLPGVRRGSRPNHPRQEVTSASGVHFFKPMPTPPSLSLSKWNTRGWCFQEKLLSKRFLVFSDQQMFWMCRSELWYEDMSVLAIEEMDHDTRLLQPLTISKDFKGVTLQGGRIEESVERRRDGTTNVVRSGTFAAYASAVHDFTARELTNSSDALNAFRGILKVLEPLFKSDTLYGLPESLLDVALLWQPRNPLKANPNRTEFPSWSWSGWIGPVSYEEPYMIDAISTRPVKKEEAPEERLRSMIKWYRGSDTIGKFELVNGSGSGIRSALNESGRMPSTWLEYDNSHKSVQITAAAGSNVSASPNLLGFWTERASFRLDHYGGGLCLIWSGLRADADQPGRHLGFIVLTDWEIAPGSPRSMRGMVELIVLSEAQFFGTPAAGQDAAEDAHANITEWDSTLGFKHGVYELYNIMYVQEIEKDSVLRYRKGLGRIFKWAWHEASPKKGLVVLG